MAALTRAVPWCPAATCLALALQGVDPCPGVHARACIGGGPREAAGIAHGVEGACPMIEQRAMRKTFVPTRFAVSRSVQQLHRGAEPSSNALRPPGQISGRQRQIWPHEACPGAWPHTGSDGVSISENTSSGAALSSIKSLRSGLFTQLGGDVLWRQPEPGIDHDRHCARTRHSRSFPLPERCSSTPRSARCRARSMIRCSHHR